MSDQRDADVDATLAGATASMDEQAGEIVELRRVLAALVGRIQKLEARPRDPRVLLEALHALVEKLTAENKELRAELDRIESKRDEPEQGDF